MVIRLLGPDPRGAAASPPPYARDVAVEFVAPASRRLFTHRVIAVTHTRPRARASATATGVKSQPPSAVSLIVIPSHYSAASAVSLSSSVVVLYSLSL